MRLSHANDYSRVFAAASRSSDRFLTVLARANLVSHPRLGLAIARKHLRRAVDRNRVKRLIRESFRSHQQALGARDFVVLARPDTRRAGAVEIRASLERHWHRLSG